MRYARRKRDFHFQGITLKRLDIGYFLFIVITFLFGVYVFGVDYASYTIALALVSWLSGKKN